MIEVIAVIGVLGGVIGAYALGRYHGYVSCLLKIFTGINQK